VPGVVSLLPPSKSGLIDILFNSFWWSNFLFASSGTDILNVPLPVAAHAGKALTVNSAGTGLEYNDPNVIKEYISGFCSGQSFNTKSGTSLTFQNVTSSFYLDGATFKDLTGSKVTYLPPPGTTLVVYEFIYMVRHENDNNALISWAKFYIDGVEQIGIQLNNHGYRFCDRVIMKVPIQITGTTSTSNVTLNNWNTSKVLEVKIAEHSSSWSGVVHESRWHYASNGSTAFSKPTLTIIAI